MATFGPASAEPQMELDNCGPAVSVRFLESSLKRYIDSLQPLIKKLQQHEENVGEFARNNDQRSLRVELIAASTTVKQGQSAQREFSRTCINFPQHLLEKYETQLSTSHNDLRNALADLKETQQRVALERQPGGPSRPPVSSSPGSTRRYEQANAGPFTPPVLIDEPMAQLQEFTGDKEKQAWQAVCSDLTELNNLIQAFSEAVNDQQELVDSITSHIDHAAVDVQQGTRTLGHAGKLKAAMLPVAGAAIGAIVGGPIGLVAGLKLGAIVSAGVVGVGGAYVGKKLQDKKNSQIDEELQGLSER